MKPGDCVVVPDRLNALAGGLEPAELISSRTRPGPSVSQGPPLAPLVMWRVRYADGTTDEMPEGAIRPLRTCQVVITEMQALVEAPPATDAPTPVIRDVAWTGEALDQADAERQARQAWDTKYPGAPRRGGDVVKVNWLPEG
jgi:hypothetical protein